MIGIIVQLLLSLILVWLVEKENLSVLGLMPTKKRLGSFLLFFLVTMFFAASSYFARMYYGERWVLNPAFSITLLFEGLWWNIKSVLFEELIFRGVILYILIKRLGMIKGILISSVAFGMYHWFTFEIWGDWKTMAVIFLITGMAGLLYAYGYAKSMSLWIPCAIHLGWNFTRNFIFSDGKIGGGVFIISEPAYTSTVSYLVYYIVAFFPMTGALLFNYLLLRRYTIKNFA